ncbi:hypothetical protein RO21_10320 [[Actinobacillus] muris]|uniref:Uncharacterized protein n=1 Tax=Muribacter muris TaxID=67855 RepID=A0A0J5S1D9_9PAST|nr:hypothetical protein [Muribacter muris]KMK50682.1 hypothetical protein RO21_10320 [[Actinobacillus] muris] [Muribacter muris]
MPNQRQRKISQRRRLYFAEQRLNRLERRQEMAQLDTEQTYDLLAQLEAKINRLIEQHRALAAEQKQANTRSVWRSILQILKTKGEP